MLTPEEQKLIKRIGYHPVSINPADFVPETLYHYTSAQGLFGIVSSDVLRGSNFAQLNDATEIKYGEAVIEDVLQDAIPAAADSLSRMVLEIVATSLRELGTSVDFFMTCFCAKGDLLSQWRGYGSASSGRFCIAFDTEEIENAKALALTLGKVEYNSTKQATKVEQVLKRIEKLLGEAPKKSRDKEEFIKGFCVGVTERLLGMLAFFKHSGFEEEQEWRAVHVLQNDSDIRFEAAGGSIRPYVELFRATPLPISHIIVGASPRAAQAKGSLEKLLRSRGYAVDVLESSIPLRDY